MVLCKYFQQGNCRFGQFCKFEHSYGGNRTKTFNEDKNIALLVAQEVLAAERGGQWLLSCYGPFKEKKCIPGMEDVSPEEVRWEMYQAQKTNTVNQVNAQYQQMCEQMKVKHEALKNPTPELFQLLESIQNSGTENSAFGDKNKTTFGFGASQLGSNTQTNNVFGQKTYGAATNNPFGTTNTFNAPQQSSSIFGKTTSNTSSVFGSKSNFGNSSVFGGANAPANSIFGGVNKSSTNPFGSAQNTGFGGFASPGTSTSVFGGSGSNQSTFGQPAAFGNSNNQATNSFIKPQTSIFGGTTSSSSVFGGSTPAAGTSVFGATATTAVSNTNTSSIFGQSTTAGAAFGGAPVFGGSSGFGAAQRPGASVFGSQPVFGGATAGTAIATAPSNVFGGTNAATSSFGGLAQSATPNAFGSAASGASTNIFGGTASTVANTFEAPPNATPFGAVAISTAASPFGSATQPAFATAVSTAPAFGGSTSAPFSQSSSFGFTTPATNTTSSNVFGSPAAATATTQSPFGSSNFGGTQQQSNTSVFELPICSPNTKSNPFVKSNANPFGAAPISQSSPFGNFSNSAGSVGLSVSISIDETGYSLENSLTDDEKAAYQMAQFSEGRIPLKPPTKELS